MYLEIQMGGNRRKKKNKENNKNGNETHQQNGQNGHVQDDAFLEEEKQI